VTSVASVAKTAVLALERIVVIIRYPGRVRLSIERIGYGEELMDSGEGIPGRSRR
jgi:hypothetical protein